MQDGDYYSSAIQHVCLVRAIELADHEARNQERSALEALNDAPSQCSGTARLVYSADWAAVHGAFGGEFCACGGRNSGRIGRVRIRQEHPCGGTAANVADKWKGCKRIFQEPSQALHPAIRVGEQVSDVIAAHKDLPRRAVREKAREVLATVFPGETERIANSYPHQLSGGQRARVLIAQAISCGPSLIIADEPTASLDPEMQQEILTVFRDLRQKLQLALIWITHYPALLAGFADRVMLSYAGKIVEIGPTERVLNSPHHPYTRSLLRSAPPSIENGKSSRKE